MDDILGIALTQLDEELTRRSLNMEIVICGAYALHLLGYSRSEHTLDVDSITTLSSVEIQQIIEAIGQKLGLGPHWLNDLVLLKPTSEEIGEAIIFIKESNSPPPNASKKIIADFEETLYDLKKTAK
ncbi:MAG TPA: hypothetical protein VIG33_08125 [Pseudobdellovibrionaceae bacterium]|jgi:hypothetical protein